MSVLELTARERVLRDPYLLQTIFDFLEPGMISTFAVVSK